MLLRTLAAPTLGKCRESVCLLVRRLRRNVEGRKDKVSHSGYVFR